MQRGFKDEDGVAASLIIIKQLINAAKTTNQPQYVAFIDFRNVFDSVFHRAILRSAGTAGLDRRSVKYLRAVYTVLSTEVLGMGTGIKRGVVHADPLSSTLFNVTLEMVLSRLPDVGVQMANITIK